MTKHFAIALFVFLAAAVPAGAWEATSGEVCEILHTEPSASVRVTYDLASRQYAIAITPAMPWDAGEGDVFALRFDGPFANIITTDRHQFSNDDATLTVTDQGFGNVLNGLAFNDIGTALLGDQRVVFSLAGADEAVATFRACTQSLQV